MKQIVQNYNSGKLHVEDVPTPICRAGGILVRAAYSLVSTGTERMKVSQARMSLVAKARARPDKVKQVLQSVQQVGLVETCKKVSERLDALTPLGYSLAGIVQEVGGGVDEFAVGDRVVCAGEGIACHAEFVAVPRNLCARVPEGVELRDAAFATVGAIALNGVRQSGATVGDCALVVGLGLVGLLAVQVLKAAGCRVIGVDLDPTKTELAKTCGADLAISRTDAGLEAAIERFTTGIGPDIAYIAASTKSTDPLDLAGRVLRDRGKVVIVGMVPVEADWQTYYDKELSVVMARSYGPGRYDKNYEQKGLDYPIGYVRWTERRNLDAFLDLILGGKITPRSLEPEVFKLEDAASAYQALHDDPGRYPGGILFEYPPDATPARHVTLKPSNPQTLKPSNPSSVAIGLIGAGNFATATLIPALKKCGHATLRAICSARGLTARSAGQRHGFEYCTSDYREMLCDACIDAVIIATHHDTHARFAAEALRAGKHVFVEKPLALNHEQLDDVLAAQQESGRILMPGYNRRFSPLSVAVLDFFASRSAPIEIICRVNAGAIAANSWYQDPEEGGWRIISEGCHFVDLIQFLCGCQPVQVYAAMIGGNVAGRQNDNCTAILRMANGSVATLAYISNGDPAAGKERIEVFGQDKTAVIDNWQYATLTVGGRTKKVKPGASGKGHALEMKAFIDAVRQGQSAPLPVNEAVACAAATFAIAESLVSGRPVDCLRPETREASCPAVSATVGCRPEVAR